MVPRNLSESRNESFDLDKSLWGIMENTQETPENRKWMKQALAWISSFLPSEIQSGKRKLDPTDLKNAMISRINFDTSKPHDIAKNIQVQAAVFEMKARIYEMWWDPAELLKKYAEMRWMIDGAIGANEASQAQQNDDFRQNQAQSNKENDLAKLSFVELGNKLRNAMDEAQRASAKARSDAITNARAAESMAQRDSRLSAESNLENWLRDVI